jgi:hypothetical protein
MTISGLARILVAAATALTLSTTPAQGREARADGPDFRAPTVGACSTMTADQAAAVADHSTVVPCSDAHTAKVAGVVRLPDRLDYSSDVVKLYRVIADRCRPKVNAMLGRSNAVRDSSAYDMVWFLPTKTQREHGARWMSCSIVLRQAFKLAELPTNKTPLLPTGRLGDGIHRCLLADTSRVITTRCAARHGWRATGAFVIDSERYPGPRAVDRKARTKCAGRVLAGRSYRWTYSSKIDWQVSGDHAVICYSKTSS